MFHATQLVGFGTPAEAAALTVSNVANAGGTTSATCPTVEPGDLILCIALNAAGSGGAGSPATGLSPLAEFSASGSTRTYFVDYKIADGSEDGSTITPGYSSVDRTALIVLRPNLSISTVVGVDWGGEATTGNPVSRTMNADSQTPGAPVVCIAHYFAGADVDLNTWSPGTPIEFDVSTNVCRIAYLIQNTSPADQTSDIGDEGTFTNHVTGMVVVT